MTTTTTLTASRTMLQQIEKVEVNPVSVVNDTRGRKIIVGGLMIEDMRFGKVVQITQITRKPIVRDDKVFIRYFGETVEVEAFATTYDIDGREVTMHTFGIK